MPSQILIKRGLQANLPSSASIGELLFTTDTKRVYVGTGSGITLVSGTFIFSQNSSSASWHINHSLGKFPSVTVVDSAGTQVFGDVTQVDANNIILNFSAPFSGTAYLN